MRDGFASESAEENQGEFLVLPGSMKGAGGAYSAPKERLRPRLIWSHRGTKTIQTRTRPSGRDSAFAAGVAAGSVTIMMTRTAPMITTSTMKTCMLPTGN